MSESYIESTDSVGLNDVYTFSPALLNQATFSWSKINSSQVEDRKVNPADLGINLPQYQQGGSVLINVNGAFILGSGISSSFFSQNFQAKDTLSWTHGRHQLKFGYEWLHLQFEQVFLGPPNFAFTGDATGNGTADFLLGRFNSGGINFGVRDTDVHTDFHSLYASSACSPEL